MVEKIGSFRRGKSSGAFARFMYIFKKGTEDTIFLNMLFRVLHKTLSCLHILAKNLHSDHSRYFVNGFAVVQAVRTRPFIAEA